MTNVPVIVISSPFSQCGKTTLSLNLAAALWSDHYEIDLFAPENELVQRFFKQRRLLNEIQKLNLYMPQYVNNIFDESRSEKHVVIAVIPSNQEKNYTDVFNQAHTLITVVPSTLSAFWNATDQYLNVIWEAKKHLASRGVKAANWVVVPYVENPSEDAKSYAMTEAARRYGFRITDIIPYRDAYNHVKEGYCAADMQKYNSSLPMTFADVYARREILQLTDFLWK